jgi:lipopolysaccharide biosynthesis glycosyltransferase
MPPLSQLSHISIATYYRLLIPELLPPTVDKVIYLDCDIVVRHSLDDLWNYPISGYGLGAVYQISNWSIDAIKRLGYPVSFGYFNAGVLLIDLKYWRENNISQQLFEYLDEKKEVIVYHDQDALNGLMYEKCCTLPCKWNMLNGFFKKNILTTSDIDNGEIINNYNDYKKQILIEKDDPTIIHFAFKPKPWEAGCTHPYKKEYYKYLQYTPWHSFKAPMAITVFLKNPKKEYTWLKEQIKRIILGNPYFQIKTLYAEGELKKSTNIFILSMILFMKQQLNFHLNSLL